MNCRVSQKTPATSQHERMVEFLRENLRLDVKTTSEYTGGMDGPLYVDRHTIQLTLGNEVLSEVYL